MGETADLCRHHLPSAFWRLLLQGWRCLRALRRKHQARKLAYRQIAVPVACRSQARMSCRRCSWRSVACPVVDQNPVCQWFAEDLPPSTFEAESFSSTSSATWPLHQSFGDSEMPVSSPFAGPEDQGPNCRQHVSSSHVDRGASYRLSSFVGRSLVPLWLLLLEASRC